MVIIADKAFEKFSLGRAGFTALPLTVSEKCERGVTYTCYKKLQKAFCALEKECSDPFSADSLISFRAVTDPFMKKYGYSFDSADTILEYEASAPLPKGKVRTVILNTNVEIGKYPADTTLWTLEVDDGDDADVICAVIKNGRIVSYASVNDIADEGGYEITVECAPSSRRCGYASSCSADLASYLISSCKAGAVYYKCREENEGSRKTAERAGFTYTGKSRSFVYVR